MISKRAEETSSFIVMDILEQANELERQGKNIIHLEVGQPDFPTPEKIKNATIESLNKNETAYTHSMGKWELREAITDHYHRKYQVNISPEQVLVTSGTSPAMLLIFHTLLESGDEFILPNPYYACYPNFLRAVGADIRFLKLNEKDSFRYDMDLLKSIITDKTKGLMVNSPSNPTGAVFDKDHLKDIANIDLPYIISDEIYHGLNYSNERDYSLLEFSDRAIVINGFSKLFAMTGYRLGYLIAPKKLMRAFQKLQQNYLICANSFAQSAGICALKDVDEDVEIMRQTYNERRIYMVQRLKEMGFSIPHEPEGAFYVFVNAQHLCSDSKEYAFKILNEAHVGVTPGIDFGSEGEGFLRFSYANSIENIKEGLKRLENFIKKQKA